MNKLLLIPLLTLIQTFSFSQNSIDNAFNIFKESSGLENASISFQVIDLSNSSEISSYNSNTVLPTASTAKLFSTATALDILGPDYQAKTRVYSDGEIDSLGTLNGNLWIRGGGDPSLGSKYFNNPSERLNFFQKWIDTLKQKGIKKIAGTVIADASEFGYEGAPNGWSWVDMGNYYGAGPSGLTLQDNLLEVYFSVPSRTGLLSTINKIYPEVPNMTFQNQVISANGGGYNAYIYGAPFSMDRFVTGTLPAGSNNFLVKGSIPDPELQFAYEFKKALLNANISVDGELKTGRYLQLNSSDESYKNKTLIISHLGEKLNSIIEYTNMRSVNLFAEHMINLIGYEKTGNGSTSSGLKVLDDYWAQKIKAKSLFVNDGSGLSRSNAISAEQFNLLMAYMNSSKYSKEFKKSLPVSGVSGTMVNICKGTVAHNRIQAKSGSMTRIKSYAGYINTTNGKQLAFSLIVNNATCSSASLTDKMELLFTKIATY